MKRMISGIKPTGQITLGNYLGAIKQFIKYQDEYDLWIFIADFHALTLPINPEELRQNIEDLVAIYLACGLDPSKCHIFRQSQVRGHCELGWLLTCKSVLGELTKMPQYKNYIAEHGDKGIPSGMLIYPALMSADILLYDADYVPVGADQMSHIDLCRDMADKFNRYFPGSFKSPSGVLSKSSSKIMSLSNPTRKMSKSESDKGTIYLLDDINISKKKIMKALTDSDNSFHYDPENKYSVPYTYGMVGIIYNSEFVDEADVEDESWSILWNEKYAGKILQFNNPRDAFATAMYWKDLDINSHDYSVWEKALELLKAQKPILQGYVNDEIFNKMKGASAYIAPYFAGDFLTMAADNEDLRFYYPSEGTNYFVDALCIPITSKNPDVAHEYINYMIGVEAATANALYIGYASPNKEVVESEYYQEMLDYNYSTDNIDAWEILYGKTKDEANVDYSYNPAYEDYYKNGDIDIQAHVTSLWESLKTENSTELWIHITSIAIVVGVLGIAIYSTYIKKKRSKFYRDRDRELRRQKQMNK
jgi:tryptophanyl-tRNA synthetase